MILSGPTGGPGPGSGHGAVTTTETAPVVHPTRPARLAEVLWGSWPRRILLLAVLVGCGAAVLVDRLRRCGRR